MPQKKKKFLKTAGFIYFIKSFLNTKLQTSLNVAVTINVNVRLETYNFKGVED